VNTRKIISCVLRDLRDNTPTVFSRPTDAAEYAELVTLAHTYGIAFSDSPALETALRLDMGLQVHTLHGPAPLYTPVPAAPTKAAIAAAYADMRRASPPPATPAKPATQGRTQAEVQAPYVASPRVNTTQAERQPDETVVSIAALRVMSPDALRARVQTLTLELARTEDALDYRVSANGRAAASHRNAAVRAAAVPATPTNTAKPARKPLTRAEVAALDNAPTVLSAAALAQQATAQAAQARIAADAQTRTDASAAAAAAAAKLANIQAGMNISPAFARMLATAGK
jgi:hypothetical protein